MRVGIAADHRGFDLKRDLIKIFNHRGLKLMDLGPVSKNPEDDYPDFIFPLARLVSRGEIDRGIGLCGSGVGASVAANKIINVRAALVCDLFTSRQGVEDDNMNFICIAAQLVTVHFAVQLIHTFLTSTFSGKERHIRRLQKISAVEIGRLNGEQSELRNRNNRSGSNGRSIFT